VTLATPRFRAIRVTAVAAALLLAASGCNTRKTPPDVLLVTLDTTRVDGLACYGGPSARTPRLDALAREGTRFEQAVTPAPYTGPSHASLLTGLDPPRHGLRDFLNQAMRPGVTTLAELLRVRGYRTGAFLSSYVLDRRFGLDRGFDVYACDFWRAVTNGEPARIVQGDPSFERRGERTVDEALEWLARPAGDAPTFAWVHLFDPHMPYDPPAPFAGETDARRRYYAEIAYADAQVGRLLDRLQETGRDRRTVIVAVADHGELLGEHGRALGTHSTHLVEATLRVPMIVRAPGTEPAVVRDPVRLVDVMPTILDLAGVAPPPDLDGRSLVPLLRGATLPPRPAYSETLYERFPEVASPGEELVSLRHGRFRLLRSGARHELYDLASDPDELRNVAAEHPEVVRALEARLADLRRRHASTPPPRTLGLDPEEAERHRERLRSLGYVR
jgi:choline-sulfatase